MKLQDFELARLYLTRSLEAARAGGEPRPILLALVNLMNVYGRTVNLKDGLALVDEAAAYAAKVADPSLTARVHYLTGVLHYLDQRWESALTSLRAALAGASERQLGSTAPVLYTNLGACLVATGDVEEARDALSRALKLGMVRDDADVVLHSCTELARLALGAGDWDDAVNYGRQALDYLWNHMGDVNKVEVARLCETFGLLAVSIGDKRKGTSLLERAGTYYGQLNYWWEWSRVSDLQRSGAGAIALKPGQLPREAVNTLDYFSDLFGLLDNIESADPTLIRRGQLVTHYALLLGTQLGLPEEQMMLLSHAGRLCDIGLTTFEPEAIADEEGARYKLHPELSARWLEDFPLPEGTGAVVRAHHERFDGKGYPDGLAGGQIPLGARLLATCETYVRAIQLGIRHDDAMARLTAESGAALDPAMVAAFTQLHQVPPR